MKRYPYTLLVAGTICLVSLAPVPEVPRLVEVPFLDKWVHFLMYGTLSLIAWVETWRKPGAFGWGGIILRTMAAPAALGGVVELAQAHLTASRSGDWLDFAANATGVALAALLVGLYALLRNYASSRHRR